LDCAAKARKGRQWRICKKKKKGIYKKGCDGDKEKGREVVAVGGLEGPLRRDGNEKGTSRHEL
jgi:hypothetical protein